MKISFCAGCRIDDAYNDLQTMKKRLEAWGKADIVTGDFNDHTLTSEMTLDECYLEIAGKTKEQFDLDAKRELERMRAEEEKYQASVPDAVETYKTAVRPYITDPDKWDYFCECLPVRLRDMYHGMEISCLLEFMQFADNRENYDDAEFKDSCKKLFDKQGHSGMSAGLTMSLIKTFCKHGEEIVSYVNE